MRHIITMHSKIIMLLFSLIVPVLFVWITQCRFGGGAGTLVLLCSLCLYCWRTGGCTTSSTTQPNKRLWASLHIDRTWSKSVALISPHMYLSFLSYSQAITDWKLFLVLVGFILFDIVLLTVFTAVPQTRLNAQFNYVSVTREGC